MIRYAVIFRTHFWDDFAKRQFARLQRHVHDGDIYILVDDTNGHVDGILHDRVVRVTEAGILQAGFARAGEGNLLWFNGDYPLYMFETHCPTYDYYLQLEYDVVFNTSIDDLVNQAASRKVDYVGLAKDAEISSWFWLPSCDGVYPIDEVRHELICISLFSARSLNFLRRRRLEMSRLRDMGSLVNWPYCEAFIPTELYRAGFTCEPLSNYGSTENYDHWPPFLEREIATAGGAFLHPVLDEVRYAASLLKYRIGLRGYFQLNSLFHRKARQLPVSGYLNLVASSFISKAARSIRSFRRTTKLSRGATS